MYTLSKTFGLMDIKKYIYAHCLSPIKVKIWDSYSMQYVVRELPCGHCLHCRNTHVNEWQTRLYAEQKYSKYVYYVTLDYAPFSYTVRDSYSLPDGKCKELAIETAAVWNNLNKNHRYGLQPLLLRRNHLQDFFKRLRFNTGIKFKYFACGEYGTKAEGTGYGRPHFHIILFSNESISQKVLEDAWTVGGYKIGKVDYNDLVANGTTNDNLKNGLNSKFVFKYVCKYLQKSGFDFESLATINFHRAYFKSLQQTIDFFSDKLAASDQQIEYNWTKYICDFSPFTCCSKRESIGYSYFKENAARFSKGDLRLFGLSQDANVFPSYFLRKAKEYTFPLSAIGRVSSKPSSSARVGYIFAVLRALYNDRTKITDSSPFVENYWCSGKLAKIYHLSGSYNIKDSDIYVHKFGHINSSDLHFYNNDTKVFYQFTGYNYKVWKKYNNIGFVNVGCCDIIDILNMYSNAYKKYYDTFIKPFHNFRVLNEKELNHYIDSTFKGYTFEEKYSQFQSMLQAYYKTELDGLYKNDLLTNNSKISF